MNHAATKDRADRFGAPEGDGGEGFRYFDKDGKELSPADWLKEVKEAAERLALGCFGSGGRE